MGFARCFRVFSATASPNWLILALDIATFRQKDEYATDAEAFIKTLKETPAATGFVEVMALSESEVRGSAQRESEGIPLPEPTWQAIKEITHKDRSIRLEYILGSNYKVEQETINERLKGNQFSDFNLQSPTLFRDHVSCGSSNAIAKAGGKPFPTDLSSKE